MEYFFINTDKSSFKEEHDINIWFENSLAINGGDYKYGEHYKAISPGDVCLMYENKVGIRAIGICLENWDGKTYTTPIYYKDNTPEYRLPVNWCIKLKEPIQIGKIRSWLGYNSPWAPSSAVVHIKGDCLEINALLQNSKMDGEFLFPDEISQDESFEEGHAKRITVNKYERNQQVREKCIEHWGAKCQVCDMSFESVYGPLGLKYIHVHHIIPLHKIKKSYKVDPINDLIPVCPNCHAMLHRNNKDILSVETLRKYVTEFRKQK